MELQQLPKYLKTNTGHPNYSFENEDPPDSAAFPLMPY